MKAAALLSAILTLLFIDVLAGINTLYLRDLSLYYYPMKHVLRDVVLGGEFPYWNPLLAAGQPLAANPEHEVFYPLTWLILLPGYDLGFRLLILLHLHICAWTMYALLRSMRASVAAAFVGALSFAIGGVVLSCLTLLPILFALAWLPLTCLFTRRYLKERKPRDFALAALSLGLQMLVGEPTTIAQTGFLLGMYALFTRDWRNVGRVGLIAIAALLAGAATILPAIDHAGDSIRARGFEFDVVTAWSTPIARVAELAWPGAVDPRHYERGTPFYLSIYPGLLITLLVGAGFVMRSRGAALTAAILGVSWLLALGDHTPLWRWLYDAGLARSVRYPEKFLLMGAFAMVVFGALALDRFPRATTRIGAVLATAFLLVDLGRTLPDLAPRMPAEFLSDPPQLARQLPRERDSWRLMHVVEFQSRDPQFRAFHTEPDLYWIRRNALRPMMPARWGIRTVMELDYDLTALLPTTDFAEVAFWLAHGRADWPALVAPMANARYLGAYDDPARALARVGGDRTQVQPVRITPLGNHPRYFFAERAEIIRDVRDFAGKLAVAGSTRGVAYVGRPVPIGPGRVERVIETANTATIHVATRGPSFLVISVTPHKYWTITIDGRAAESIVTNVGFQGVVIPEAGRHVVQMRYRNPLVLAGAAISAAALLALAFVAITMRAL